MIKIDFKKLISATLISAQVLMPVSYVLSLSDIMFQTVTKGIEVDNQPPLADITAVQKKKVDIVFTVGDTSEENLLELEQKVEANLSSKVKAAGGDLIDTYVKTIETSEISSTTFGIDEILNSWTTVGGDRWVSSNGELTFNAPGKPLYVMEDGNWQGTLLYDPNALETEDLEIEFNNVLQPNLMQGVGWRITKNADGSFNGYFLNIGTHANANGISIMKFTNTRFDEPFTGNSFGFSQSETVPTGLSPTPYSQSIWCWNTGPLHKGRVTYNVGGRRIEHLGVYNTGLQGSIQIKAKGSNFKVYNNGVKIMEVNDSEYSSGTYGFWGNNCEVSGSVRLTDIKIKKDKILSLDEVLRTYTWRDNSIKFLINLDDTAKSLGNISGTVDETEYMKIISKLLEEKIYYIGIGDSSAEDISNKVINEINNRGAFYQVDPKIMNFRYTGGPQAVKLSKGGYRLETWGAAGGGAPANTGMGSSQGAGGYTEGFINIELEHKMQVYVGGKGEYSNAINEGGGWNGGGDGGPGGFGGGGATDIRSGFYSDILHKPISPSLGRFYDEATMHPRVAVTNIAGLDVINIKPGANHEHIMLNNVFKKGFEYVIEFDAYSTVEGDVVHVDAHPDMLPERTFTLTTEKKRYSMDMKSNLPEFGGSALRFFDSGEITKGNIYISNIKVYETKNAQNEYTLETGMSENGTITYGPYVNAHEGVYQVDVYGENMTGATVDAVTNNGVGYPVSSIKWHSPNRFSYYATITKDINVGTEVTDEDGQGLEFRVHHSGLTNYKFHKQVVTRLQDRILVAGGGGGADNAGGVLNGSDDGSGGHAGGLNGNGAKIDGVIQPGTAATQTGGFSLGRGESVTTVTDTGGAGGGYYGGRVTNHNNGGGGGGSALYTRVPGSTVEGFQSMPNPMSDNLMIGNTGNGFARITRISGDSETITTALEKSSDYIIDIINSTVIPKSKYILLDSDMKYDITYSDYEGDEPVNVQDINWKYDHDKDFYENSTGEINNNRQWISSGINPYEKSTMVGEEGLWKSYSSRNFDKVGKYTVEYRTKDNPVPGEDAFQEYRKWSSMPNGPLTLYVHRKPLAEAKFTVTKHSPTMNVNFSSEAYDLDHESLPNKGIIAREWLYKKVGDINWSYGGNGMVFSFLGDITTDYIVRHRVQDMDGEGNIGVWNEKDYLVTSKSLPPVASFKVTPNIYPVRTELNLIDNSYDPNGDLLVEYQWVLMDPSGTYQMITSQFNGSGINKGSVDTIASTVKAKIDALGHSAYGDWKLSLRVRDISGGWTNPLSVSDSVTRTITVVPNNGQPSVTISPTNVFVDGENLADTDNLTNPLNKFITWNSIVSDLDTDNKGFVYKWDLEHFEADDGKVIRSHSDTSPTDKVKEYNYNTTVPFSNKSFKEQSLKPGPYKITATVTDIPTYGAPISASKTEKFYVVPNLTGISQILHDKDEVLCGDTVTLRVNTDYITDAVQVKVLSDTIDMIKVSESNGNAVWEAPYTIPELPDTQDVNFKFTLSTYFGSQDIYGNANTVTRIKTINQTVNVIALKLEDFRITEMVNHDYFNYSYPIFKENMPVDYIAGYYVTLKIDAKGDPTQVISKVSTDGGATSTNLEFTKTGVNGTKSIWQARYFIEPNALEGTIITNDITAYKNTTTYNYNTKEVWDGETLKVVSGLEKDIIIKRTN